MRVWLASLAHLKEPTDIQFVGERDIGLRIHNENKYPNVKDIENKNSKKENEKKNDSPKSPLQKKKDDDGNKN